MSFVEFDDEACEEEEAFGWCWVDEGEVIARGANLGEVASILYCCAEAIRIAAVLLSPAMPGAMGELLARFGQRRAGDDGAFRDDAGNVIPLEELCAWGGLQVGTEVVKGDALFPRLDVDAELGE